MTIQERIYKRLLNALAKLKKVDKVNETLFKEFTQQYLGNKLSMNKLQIKLMDEQVLLQVATITILMEAAKTPAEFEKLHKQQKQSEADFDNKLNGTPTQPLTDFDKILKGMLQVPEKRKKPKI